MTSLSSAERNVSHAGDPQNRSGPVATQPRTPSAENFTSVCPPDEDAPKLFDTRSVRTTRSAQDSVLQISPGTPKDTLFHYRYSDHLEKSLAKKLEEVRFAINVPRPQFWR